MKKKILGLAMLISVVSAFAVFMPSASAAVKSGQCLGYGDYSSASGWQYQSNATWSFDTATGALTIGGTGNAHFEKKPDGYTDFQYPLYLDLDFDMEDVTSLVIGDGITELQGFNDLINVETFPSVKNVTTIEHNSFLQCGFENVVIPDCITTIRSTAFTSYFMNEVTFSKNMSVIECETFLGGPLERVTIPVNIKTIESSAFFTCENIKDVYYGGTKAQWNGVSGNDNEALMSAVIHCTDGDIAPTIIRAPDNPMYTISGNTTTVHVPFTVKANEQKKYEVEVCIIRGGNTITEKATGLVTFGSNIVDVNVPTVLLAGDIMTIRTKPIV